MRLQKDHVFLKFKQRCLSTPSFVSRLSHYCSLFVRSFAARVNEQHICSPGVSNSTPLISSASSNQSVYAGDTVIVTASINRSRFGKKLWCNIALYNGCEFDDCEYESGNISNTFSATFQVKNVLNQTKVQFVVIDNGILCFNDSFINIKDVPNLVQNAQWNMERQDITVSCTLLQGSIDTGCTIMIHSLENNIYKTLNLSHGSENAVIVEGTIEPLPEGPYQIEVKDSWDYGLSTRPNPAFVNLFRVFREELPFHQPIYYYLHWFFNLNTIIINGNTEDFIQPRKLCKIPLFCLLLAQPNNLRKLLH